MDDIKDPSGKDKSLDTSKPAPPDHPVHEIGPESERRGGAESEPKDDD